MAKIHPHLRLVKPLRKVAAPKFSIPDEESDLHAAAEHWLVDQLIDNKREDFIVDRDDFKELIEWSLVTWKSGKPYLNHAGRNLGTHLIRVPGTRFA
jgi:hypothetical protein